MYFKDEPVKVLDSMEDVRQALSEPHNKLFGFSGLECYRIKSLWLISVIDEIAASGQYPYNATVKKLAEEKLGLPPKTEVEYSREGDTLSLLIYNAQGYRHSDRLKTDGYHPFTRELLLKAFETGQQIEIFSDGIMGSSVRTLTPKQFNGGTYAMLPRSRTKYIMPIGQPARIKPRQEVTQ